MLLSLLLLLFIYIIIIYNNKEENTCGVYEDYCIRNFGSEFDFLIYGNVIDHLLFW